MLNVNYEAMDLRTEIENIVHEILMEGVTKEDAVNELLNLHSVSNSVRQEIERRRDLIISEPDGIVRETMISNLAIDL